MALRQRRQIVMCTFVLSVCPQKVLNGEEQNLVIPPRAKHYADLPLGLPSWCDDTILTTYNTYQVRLLQEIMPS